MKWFLPLAVLVAAGSGSLSAQQFVDQTSTRLPISAIWSEAVDAADIDGDGDLDLIWGCGDGYDVAGTARQSRILLNSGSGFFTDQTASRLPVLLENVKDARFVDVNGDGHPDLVFANAFGHLPRLLLNNGSGVFLDVTSTNLPGIPLNSFAVAAADVDDDGDLDLVFTDSGPSTFGGSGGQPRLYLNDGTGHFTDATSSALPAVLVVGSTSVAFADVDGDFDLDLIVVSKAGQSRLFLNDGLGHFTSGTLPPDGNSTYHYALGDLDGDNDPDIFVIGVNGLAEGEFRNNGAGVFTDVSATAVVGNPGSSDDNASAIGDIDNDGDFDVAIAALTTADRILVNNGAGVLTYSSTLITSVIDSSLDIKFADVDHDGDLDIVTAVGESGAFQNRIYLNNGPADTRPPIVRLHVPPPSTPWGEVVVRGAIRDIKATETDPQYPSTTLSYSINGATTHVVPMRWVGADVYRGVIPGVPANATVTCTATCIDRSNNSGTSAPITFSPGGTPPLTLAATTQGQGDANIVISSLADPLAEEYLLVSSQVPFSPGTGPFLGLGPDALGILQFPPTVPPLHGYLGSDGVQVTVIPPGGVPLGARFDARAVVLNGVVKLSNIVRIQF